jgi:hypothetical protein
MPARRRSATARPLAALFTLALTVAGTAAAGDDSGFVSLFNGKDLSGWEGDSRYWSVQDGAITARTTPETPLKSNTFLIWRGGKPSDFELRATYRIKGGNSGVQYRSKVLDAEKFVVGGYQADIDAAGRFTGINYEERGRGILAERGQRVTIGYDGRKSTESVGDKAELQKAIKADDWNEYVITARGNRLTHAINGAVTSEVIDMQGGKSSASGVIALQVHVGPPMTVQFKDVKLKELGK